MAVKPQDSNQTKKFATPDDIQRVLHTHNEAALLEGLTALRNQLTVKYNEDNVVANDERLLLAKAWLEADGALHDLFDIWGQANTRQTSLLCLIVSVLSSLITLLSSQYTYHHLASTIIKTLLSSQWTFKLNSYLSTSQNELLLMTLKLYNSLAMFAGGRESRNVFEAFPWELKSLPKLLSMRRRSKSNEQTDVLVKPDIRTLFILFLLSFTGSQTPSAVKALFLEQRRDNFSSIFKGIMQDSYALVRLIVETCWAGIWSDVKIKRTVKINIFNETVVGQVLKLYERTVSEGDNEDDIPADLAHHFLLAICTRPGTGVCFRDQGWYPREDEDVGQDQATEGSSRSSGRVYNKILANVLKLLRVNEDARQQELAIRVLQACPELVAGYWHAAALTLEPRLSSKWIANVAFVGSVISSPVPKQSFSIPSDPTLYRPYPPPLNTIMENILPSSNIKTHISRGLQSTSALVQHCTALTLAKCLQKYGSVLKTLKDAENALEEDEDGLWANRRKDTEKEASRRVPDFQVVVAFAQQKTMATENDSANRSQVALLQESALRLLWLYHHYLPQLAAEARFDVSKLLFGIQTNIPGDENLGGLTTLRRLHTLRLLNASEEFSLVGKPGSSRGNFSTLLTLYVKDGGSAIRPAIAALLKSSLSLTLLFQHDPDEVDLWLRSLPATKRDATAKAPDGTPLPDELEVVVGFLDDCMQRCLKTPYRYLEDLETAWPRASRTGESLQPSPMLMTVLEQLEFKFTRKLMLPQDCLAVMTFIRKLALRLASKAAALKPLTTLASRLAILSREPGSSSVMYAIGREVYMLVYGMSAIRCPFSQDREHESTTDTFLAAIEHESTPQSPLSREFKAAEVIDWLRFTQASVTDDQFRRLLEVIQRLHAPAIRCLLEYVLPGSRAVWNCVDLNHEFFHHADYLLLFVHTSNGDFDTQSGRKTLLDAVFQQGQSTADVKRVLTIVGHRLGGVGTDTAVRDLLLLVADVLRKCDGLPVHQIAEIVNYTWQIDGVVSYARIALSSTIRPAFEELIKVSSNVAPAAENLSWDDHRARWISSLKEDLVQLNNDDIATASLWFCSMNEDDLLQLLDHIHSMGELVSDSAIRVVEGISSALLEKLTGAGVISVAQRVTQLHSLAVSLPKSTTVHELFAVAVNSSLPLFYDGHLPMRTFEGSLATLVTKSLAHWHVCLSTTAVGNWKPLLEQEGWITRDAGAFAATIYRKSSLRDDVLRCLLSPESSTWPLHSVALMLYPIIDTAFFLGSLDDISLTMLFKRMQQGLEDHSVPLQTRLLCERCIALIPKLSASLAIDVFAALVQDKQSHRYSTPPLYLLSLMGKIAGVTSHQTASELVEDALKWSITALSTNGPLESETYAVITVLGSVVKILDADRISVRSAETVAIAVVQHRLSDPAAVSFAKSVVESVTLKPAIVNRILQQVLQHADLYPLGRNIATELYSDARSCIISFLHHLFHVYPTNTCQPSHIDPLLPLYRGTWTVEDQQLLSIFRLYETTRKTSIASLLERWASGSDISCGGVLDSILTLDATQMLRTCLQFPQRSDRTNLASTDDAIYDPLFIALLFSRMLAAEVPSTALGWVQMFRTNIVSLLIRTLSAHSTELRGTAMTLLAGLYHTLQDADLQEKPHVLYILGHLKNAYTPTPTDEYPPRLPAYITLHLAHALRGLFYPSNFTYPLTARFLMQRPELDTKDMPLLYSMLYSSSEQCRKERAWIVRFMSDGMVGRREWKILRRRHTWDLLASIFNNERTNLTLRRSILELLANLTSERHATTALVLGSGLVSWIELQLQHVQSDEDLAWIKIIENIMIIADTQKLETSTDGEWRAGITRCILVLVQNPGCSSSAFGYIARVILRLSALDRSSDRQINQLICPSVARLSKLETALSVSAPIKDYGQIRTFSVHTSHTLWKAHELEGIRLWGQCTEWLWSATMSMENKCSEWDSLTSRLLVWRAIAGEGREVAEYARREVIRQLNLSYDDEIEKR